MTFPYASILFLLLYFTGKKKKIAEGKFLQKESVSH